jgi:hypothetical protein
MHRYGLALHEQQWVFYGRNVGLACHRLVRFSGSGYPPVGSFVSISLN